MVTRLEEMENWLIGKEPPRWQLILRDTVYGIDYDAKVDIDALLAVAEAAAAYLVADKAWKDVRDDDDMDEDEVNDLWRAETDAYIALEAAVAPLLIEVTE